MAKQKDPNKVDRRKEKRGPRTSFYIVGAVNKNGELMMKEIQANTKEDAATAFKNETKLAPAQILEGLGSGYYQVKGTSQTQANRLVVRMSMDDVQYGKNRWKAILNGYHVLAQGLQACKGPDGEFKTDELVWVIVQQPVDPENKPPKPRLGDVSVIRFSDLENPVSANK